MKKILKTNRQEEDEEEDEDEAKKVWLFTNFISVYIGTQGVAFCEHIYLHYTNSNSGRAHIGHTLLNF